MLPCKLYCYLNRVLCYFILRVVKPEAEVTSKIYAFVLSFKVLETFGLHLLSFVQSLVC